MLHLVLKQTDSKQRKAGFKTRDSPGWMRPGGVSQLLLMHMNCSRSTVLFLAFSLSPANQDFCWLATTKGQDIPSTLDPDLHSGGVPVCSAEREGQAGFEPSRHQLGSEGHTFPGFLFPGGDLLGVWAQTQKGAKALRGRETATFTRWEFKRK